MRLLILIFVFLLLNLENANRRDRSAFKASLSLFTLNQSAVWPTRLATPSRYTIKIKAECHLIKRVYRRADRLYNHHQLSLN